MEPNRSNFAAVVADAYMSQYGPEERRSPVMNNPAVDYDPHREMFGWGSSLTPPDGDVRVLELEDGMFGPEDITEEDIIAYLEDDTHPQSNELWAEVLATIASGADEGDE